MRIAVLSLTMLLLWGCHGKLGCVSESSQGRSRQAGLPFDDRSGPTVARTGQDTTWQRGLSIGPNGPIPLIVVDQFGYRILDVKVAVLRDPHVGYDAAVDYTPGTRFGVVDKRTGVTVKQGPAVAWNNGATDSSSGDRAWWFDFSDLQQPGTYTIVDFDRQIRSVEFDIDDAVYHRVLKNAVRMFFYQRAGFRKTSMSAGADWADAASHLGNLQDPHSHSWLDKRDSTLARDLRGGWFDAGDYNKYTSWTARAVIGLLRAFEENPSAFGDNFDIAESGNGIPDVLDEVKWALDWLKRMQNSDGAFLCVQGLSAGSPPSAAVGPSYYGPATTAASLMGAAAFAYAAKIYEARSELELEEYGADLATRAGKAWEWANSHPKELYYNNDNSKQAGSSGLAAGQQEMDEAERQFAKFEAAVHLFELTKDSRLSEYIASNYTNVVPTTAPSLWVADQQETLLYYAKLPEAASTVQKAIIGRFMTNVIRNADQWPMIMANSDPYRAPIKGYTWGSNKSKAMQARIYQLVERYGDDAALGAKAVSAAEEYVHYIHGVNPLGLVYLTNMGQFGAEHSVKTLFHTWFADGSPKWDAVTDDTPGPAPGYLVGGPNPGFALDACCAATFPSPNYHCRFARAYALCTKNYSPPIRQPDQKSYLQFNSDWPANSWSITEPSIGYQAQYVRVLAAYAR